MLFNQNQMGRMIGQYMWSTGSSTGSPKVSIYDIETREVGTYTIVNNLASSTGFPTTSFPTAFRWNPNGTTLAVSYGISPYIYWFNKIGNTYTKLDNPATLPNKVAQCCAWHPSGDFCVVGFDPNNTNGQIMCYERSGNTFTNTGTFDQAITATIYVMGMAFNPQGDTLACGLLGAPWLALYKFNSNTKAFTKIANPSITPTGNGTGVAWGGTNSEYLSVSHDVSPRITIYYRTGDVLNKAANPATLPPNNCTGGDISADGNFIIQSVYLNGVSMFRRDTATTNTWINIGQTTGTPVYGRHPHIYPGNNGQ